MPLARSGVAAAGRRRVGDALLAAAVPWVVAPTPGVLETVIVVLSSQAQAQAQAGFGVSRKRFISRSIRSTALEAVARPWSALDMASHMRA